MGFFQSLFNKEKNKKEIVVPKNVTPSNKSPLSPSPVNTNQNTNTAASTGSNHRRRSSVHSISSHHILPATSPLALSPQSSVTPSAINSTKTPTPPQSRRQSIELARRFVLLEDGTHQHHLTPPTQNRITASLNGLVTGLAHKSLRLTQWTERKVSMEDILKERDALNVRLHRSKEQPQQTLAQKWGICQETIGKGASGVVRVAHKVDSTGQRLYAVKVRNGKWFQIKHRFTRQFPFFFICIIVGTSKTSSRNIQRLYQSFDLRVLHFFHCRTYQCHSYAGYTTAKRNISYLLSGYGI